MQSHPTPSAHACTPPADCSAAAAEAEKTIAALRRRLHKWELDHLRKLSAELADKLETAQQRIDDLEAEAARAWDVAESWRNDALDLVNDLQDCGKQVGLTKAGALVVMPDEGGAE